MSTCPLEVGLSCSTVEVLWNRLSIMGKAWLAAAWWVRSMIYTTNVNIRKGPSAFSCGGNIGNAHRGRQEIFSPSQQMLLNWHSDTSWPLLSFSHYLETTGVQRSFPFLFAVIDNSCHEGRYTDGRSRSWRRNPCGLQHFPTHPCGGAVWTTQSPDKQPITMRDVAP